MRIILPALSCKGFIYIHNEDIIGTSVREGDAGQILQGLSTHSQWICCSFSSFMRSRWMQSEITGHMVDRAPMLHHVICQNNALCHDIAQSSNCNGMMIAFDMPIGKLKNTCFTE